MLLDKKEIMRRSPSNITAVLVDTLNTQNKLLIHVLDKLEQVEKKLNAPKKTKSPVAGTKAKSA